MDTDAKSEPLVLWQERVAEFQRAYQKRNVSSPVDNGDSGLGFWYGRLFDPLKFKLKGVGRQNGVSSNFGRGVLQEWARPDTSRLVELPPKIKSLGAYEKQILGLCEKIELFTPLPRSKPKYRIIAARHPLGGMVHGTYLPLSGETLQLVASIERNDPLWVFIASCVRILAEDVLEEISNLERHGSSFQGDSRTKWEALRKKLCATKSLLKIRGVNASLSRSKIGPKEMGMVFEKVQRSGRHAETVMEILRPLKCILGGAPRNHEQSNRNDKDREYLAHIPHMFEWYLKAKVSEKLEDSRPYEVWGGSVKKSLPCLGRREFQEKVYPDIVIKEGAQGTDGERSTNALLLACIDAKVKEKPRQSHADKYEMISYIEALKTRNRENGVEKPIRGVIFVAVYGTEFDDAKDELDDGPKLPTDDNHDEIRFTFVHVHKNAMDADRVREAIERKLEKALEFFFPQGSLASSVRRHGLKLHDAGGQGDCQFRALHHQLVYRRLVPGDGNNLTSQAVRQWAVSGMEDFNAAKQEVALNEYKALHPGNDACTYKEFLERMRQPRVVWGANASLQAVAGQLAERVLRRPVRILVHRASSEPITVPSWGDGQAPAEAEIVTLHLALAGELHYFSAVESSSTDKRDEQCPER
jgi:hypothetical protein